MMELVCQFLKAAYEYELSSVTYIPLTLCYECKCLDVICQLDIVYYFLFTG